MSDSLWHHGLQHIRLPCPLLRFLSTELVMPSNHLILCHPLLLLPSIFPSIRVFSKQSVLCIRLPKYYTVRPFMYDHLHLLIVNSQSISPPLLSSLAITSLFSMSVSLFLFHRYVLWCHILDSTYKWYHMVFVFFFLTSLSVMISGSIHVVANGIILFYFMAEQYSTVYMYFIFICSSVKEFSLRPYPGCCK